MTSCARKIFAGFCCEDIVKTQKSIARKRPPPASKDDLGEMVEHLGTKLAAKLTNSWGPLLAFIAFVAISGLLALQFARSDTVALGMSAIVVVALIVALVGRIKNVL
jgi:hypothetical protein